MTSLHDWKTLDDISLFVYVCTSITLYGFQQVPTTTLRLFSFNLVTLGASKEIMGLESTIAGLSAHSCPTELSLHVVVRMILKVTTGRSNAQIDSLANLNAISRHDYKKVLKI